MLICMFDRHLVEKIRSRKGMTLPESMVSILILSVIFSACLMILLSGSNIWQVNNAKTEIKNDMRRAMESIKEDFRQAGPGSVIDVPPDGSWRTSATFRISNGVSGGTINWSSNTVQYSLSGSDGKQLHRVMGLSDRLVANNIQTIQFRRQSSAPDIMEVNVLAQKDSLKGHSLQLALNFEVQMRN